MDRGAWQADTVHGVARVGHDLATKPPTPLCQLSPKHLIPSQSSSLLGESGPTRWPQEPSLFSPPPCFVLLQPVPYTGSPAPSRCIYKLHLLQQPSHRPGGTPPASRTSPGLPRAPPSQAQEKSWVCFKHLQRHLPMTPRKITFYRADRQRILTCMFFQLKKKKKSLNHPDWSPPL